MHSNADLTALINEGSTLLRSAVSLMPRGSGGAGTKTPEEIFGEIAADIETRLPNKYFDIDAVKRKYPTKYEDSMNTVLVQELLRFEKLYDRIKGSLSNLQRAIKGLVVMTPDLEAVGGALFDNKQPALWQKVSYPSLKPLGGYMSDFLSRLEFLRKWIDHGPSTSFWISGFFFTQARAHNEASNTYVGLPYGYQAKLFQEV